MLHRGASGTYGAPDLSHCCTTHTEREAFYFHLLIQKKKEKFSASDRLNNQPSVLWRMCDRRRKKHKRK